MSTLAAHIAQQMEEDHLQKLGMKIRKLRLEQELSQDKLALMIGSSESKAYISRIELGKSNISISVLYRIAKALGVKVRDLIDF